MDNKRWPVIYLGNHNDELFISEHAWPGLMPYEPVAPPNVYKRALKEISELQSSDPNYREKVSQILKRVL